VSALISGAVELIGGGIVSDERELDLQSLAKLYAYVGELADAKAGSEAGDLTAHHMRAVGAGELTREECVSQIMLMTMAGVATTTHLIGNFFKAMFEFPAELEAVRTDPGLIDSAVLEALRSESPVQAVFRIVRTDAELGGVTIPKASYVLAFIGSGNRDERHYADPDVFIANRDPRDHLAFAPGVHNCLGGPLARLETRIAVETILRRTKRLELREPIVMVPNMALRGPRSVNVAFEEG
jgi:cytochrome P450